MRRDGIYILTPEHVEIELVPAGLGSRFFAWLIDLMLTIVLCLGVMYGSGVLMGLSPAAAQLILITVLWVVAWGYHVFFESIWQGRTPGKRAMGLRVVDDRGLPVTLQQSVTRNMVRIMDMQPVLSYGCGALVSLLNREQRRLGDIAAGTLVVREAFSSEFPGKIAGGPQYNSLRVPRVLRLIRQRISLEEREFLLSLCLRAPSMNDQLRFDLMEQVGAGYREKLNIDDPHLSGENLVRGLTSILFEKRGEN